MKVLYVTQYYFPEITAAAFRAYDNSKIWTEEGLDVNVFTAYPNHPLGKVYDGYNNKLISEHKVDGVRVIRSKISAKRNSSKFKRGLISLSFMFYGLINAFINRKKIGKDFDVILGTSGPVFAAVAAYAFSILYKKPFVLEIRDITYIQMLGTFSNKKSFMYKVIKRLELYLCKKANKVVTVTEGFKKKLIQEGIDKYKIEVIHNGVIFKDNIKNDTNLIKEKKDEFILSYIGTFGISQNLKDVLIFFNNIKINNKKLYLIGDGAEKNKLKEFIEEQNINSVKMLDSVPKKKLRKYYKNTDMCIVALKNNEFFSNTIPSKLFDIMANKKPILYLGPEGEVANIVKKANCGFVYTDTDYKIDAEKFTDDINYLINEKKLVEVLCSFGENGFSYVGQNFDRKELSRKYMEFINDNLF